MARKLELTWDKRGKRWKKKYKGRQYYFAFGQNKSDVEGYKLALAAWHQTKLDVDGADAWDKRNGHQYRSAIEVREGLIRWFESVGQLDGAEKYRSEIAELQRRYQSHRHPLALELYDLSPLYDDAFLIKQRSFCKSPAAVEASRWVSRVSGAAC